ncbi:MAG: peptide chain release factor 1 [Lentisphaerae bacterium]|nr:peptide chain release factor 1 [Lentisphaerota bacterium]
MINHKDVEKLLSRIPEIETELSKPETASNPNTLRELVREHAALKKIEEKAEAFLRLELQVAEYREVLDSGDAEDELRELAAEEIDDLKQRLPGAERELMVALLPSETEEIRNAIMEIRAGTGGDEAALFGADLFRMYGRYAEEQGWKTGIIDASPSDIGGYKEVVFSVEGPGAYGALQYESGVHRVQRVPVTESSGRVHTSAATVAVFPEAEAEDDLAIGPEDLRIDIFRSSGPGGQSVNTTDSAVRITHIPTGIVVQSQDERSQHRNKDKAMAVLKARILDHLRREEDERMGNARRSQIGSGDRSERIRTYNFPQNRLTDHRIGLTRHGLDRVMEGDLTELLDALREHDIELRIQHQLDIGLGDPEPPKS